MLTRDSDCDGQCDSFLRSARQSVSLDMLESIDDSLSIETCFTIAPNSVVCRLLVCEDEAGEHVAASGGAPLLTSLADSALQMQSETSQSTFLGSFALPVSGDAGGSRSRVPSVAESDDRDCRDGASSSYRSYRELDLQHVHHGGAFLIPA
jgi:hypothetical protein